MPDVPVEEGRRLHAEAVERVRRSWEFRDGEPYMGATFLLCEDTGEIAGNGNCPVHGGDACLFVYGKVLLLDPARNPALADLVAHAKALLEAAERAEAAEANLYSHHKTLNFGESYDDCPICNDDLVSYRAAEAALLEAAERAERADQAEAELRASEQLAVQEAEARRNLMARAVAAEAALAEAAERAVQNAALAATMSERAQAAEAERDSAEQNQRYMLTPAEAFYAQGAMEMVGPDGTKDGLALWESALAKLTARAGNVR